MSSTKKAYICFDYDHDLGIKNSLVKQSMSDDSPFSIKDMSIKEAISEEWKRYARQRIRGCDVVIILCGEFTDTANGVTAELSITREEEIPHFFLKGRRNKSVKPKGAKSTDKMHNWTWNNLKLLINDPR